MDKFLEVILNDIKDKPMIRTTKKSSEERGEARRPTQGELKSTYTAEPRKF